MEILMKKYIFALLCLFSTLAADWRDSWIKAIEACSESEYFKAEQSFSQAINELEQIEDFDHPYVYVDRARLYLLLEKFPEALLDLDKAISSEKLVNQERIRAVISRIMARSRLGMDQGVLDDLKYFGEIYPNMPKIEETERNLIIRNMPDCECYRDIMTCYFVNSGICNSKDDIKMLKSGICIVNKVCEGSADESSIEASFEEKDCDHCEKESNVLEGIQANVEGCNSWCDRFAIAGATWCANTFKYSNI